ncbi:MAG: tRNA (N(6)-L-threonylcarbamoyladenosine(37)-C(2))-methylthiotransferase MtaB [Bacteroidota bacterium]|nr:tRNA (N(6)-L-threonylcarbamoyladenosine(37)-C(2))-methylthiotransferase MtaB [Bacteroidota bacterium]
MIVVNNSVTDVDIVVDSHLHTVSLYTLGCKLNYAEGSSLLRKLANQGYKPVDFEEHSDVYIVNTCSVTDHADNKTKRLVKSALLRNPNAFVIIIGCYAQLKPEEILEIPGVSLVLGANEKFNLAKHIDSLYQGCEPRIFNAHIKDAVEFNASYSVGNRTRSFLKVQDGCNYFCSFCTIPLARGRSRSSYIADVIENVKEIAQQGVKEIVLTGVNIGDLTNDKNETFFDLVLTLDKLKYTGIERFRISSIEPNLLEDRIIKYIAESELFVPHFHIPLQSGSDVILQAMRRRYQAKLYADRVHLIKQLMPNACIGVDVITGFPGETDEEFLKTYNLLETLPVSYFHVFTYSERPNTTALRLAGKVPNNIRQKRNAMLTELGIEKKSAFYHSQIGAQAKVLWEKEDENGDMFGFSDNYLRATAPYNESKTNQLELVTMDSINEAGIFEITR